MSAPFHFPTEYGKLGNWPGSLGPNQAQALLMEAVTHKAGAKFVELGFDGGRTTIVLGWAAREIGNVKIVSAPVMRDETGLWFRRARILFKIDVDGEEALPPFAANLIVMNPMMPFAHDWVELAPVGASIVLIGNERGDATGMKEVVSQPGITIWKKVSGASRAIDKAISSVVSEFSESKPMDNGQRAKIHSLRRNKERLRDSSSTDTKIHEVVVADKGAELLPS